MSDAAAVYVIVLFVEAAVAGLAALRRGDGFAVHSSEAAPVVYSAPAQAAAESHGQTWRSEPRV